MKNQELENEYSSWCVFLAWRKNVRWWGFRNMPVSPDEFRFILPNEFWTLAKMAKIATFWIYGIAANFSFRTCLRASVSGKPKSRNARKLGICWFWTFWPCHLRRVTILTTFLHFSALFMILCAVQSDLPVRGGISRGPCRNSRKILKVLKSSQNCKFWHFSRFLHFWPFWAFLAVFGVLAKSAIFTNSGISGIYVQKCLPAACTFWTRENRFYQKCQFWPF